MSKQPPNVVFRIWGILIVTAVIVATWSVFQRPMEEYGPIAPIVFAVMMSMTLMFGIMTFILPTMKEFTRNYIEKLMKEEEEE